MYDVVPAATPTALTQNSPPLPKTVCAALLLPQIAEYAGKLFVREGVQLKLNTA